MKRILPVFLGLAASFFIAVPAFAADSCTTKYKGTCIPSASCEQGVTQGTKKIQANTDCETTSGNVCCVAVSASAPKTGSVTTVGYGLKNPLGNRTIPQIVGDLVAWLGGLAGVLFFGHLLWGGIEWMTAQGDPKQVAKAQGHMMSSVFGIAIILLAYFVIDAIMGLPNMLIGR